MARKKLSDREMEEELERFFESEDDDDSIRDPNYSSSNLNSDISDSEDEPLAQAEDDDFDVGQTNVSSCLSDASCLIWSRNIQLTATVRFTGNEGVQVNFLQNHGATPMDIFFSIIDNNIMDIMVRETNRYARQLLESKAVTRGQRLSRWKDTDKDELKKFLGVLLFMGLINFPKIECYWKRDNLYYHPIMHKINMSYNRFSLLLRCWHFVDNSLPREGNDRLYKINPLLDPLIANIQKMYTPGKTVAIDESMVLFRGRLQFRQYNPGKKNKYGIKMYKLSTSKGFVWNFKVYCGNDPTIENLDKPGSIVVTLGKDLLNEGRLFITDNWYTSIPLALYLMKHNTYLCGTLRKNKRFLPKEVVNSKLKRSESSAMQADKITVLKWHDKRDVLVLSTCEDDGMTEVGTGRNFKPKPNIIITYNKGKQGIDISDQMSSYYSCLRKSLIWYKKVAVEVICGTVIVNSHILYNELHVDKPMRQLEFIERLVHQILDLEDNTVDQAANATPGTSSAHFLEEIPRKSDGTIKRKRCHGCYAKNKQDRDSDFAAKRTKQVSTECKICEKAFCLNCFKEHH